MTEILVPTAGRTANLRKIAHNGNITQLTVIIHAQKHGHRASYPGRRLEGGTGTEGRDTGTQQGTDLD